MNNAITSGDASSDHRAFAMLAATAISFVFGIFGTFAAIAPLDSAAVAPGRVAAESSTKTIQHLEGGIVREMLVKEAQAVKEGDVLFRLAPTQAQANADMIRKQLDGALALEARLSAERESAPSVIFPAEILARRSTPETAMAIADQERQFDERRASLKNQTMILRTRFEQTSNELSGLRRREKSLTDQITNLSSELASLTELREKGLYPKSKLMALQRQKAGLEGELGGMQGELARLADVQRETKLQISQLEQKFREEAGQQLAEVRARLSDIREKTRVADDVMNRIEVRAPQDGVVQGLKVHSAGAVIRPGETLAELVPTGDKLVMAVRVSPLDIDNVEPGQRAEVRLPGFAARGLKTILGKVERVGADVMLDDYTKEPYYMARVEVDPKTVPAEIQKRLQPGMPADVLITTGERTALQYLIGPLADLIAKSMREQ